MKWPVVALTLSVTFAGVLEKPQARQQPQGAALSRRTLDNLSTAMHGEAFAYAKYLLYAQHARQSGNERLARLLEETARTERFEHFAEEAKLAGVVGSDEQNLKSAIEGESYEAQTMYRTFAEQAEQDGNHAAAERFNEIRNDEAKHRAQFEAALSGLRTDTVPVKH